MSKNDIPTIQDIYEYHLANKTTWYKTYMEALLPQLKEVLKEDYILVESIYKYIIKLEKPNGLYSTEDLFKIKVNVALKHIKEINEDIKETRETIKEFEKNKYNY